MSLRAVGARPRASSLACARRAVARPTQGPERLAGVRRVGAGRRRHEVLPVRLHEPQLGRRDSTCRSGPDNGFNAGGADQGQPTHFLPRRNRFVFRVKVPAGFTREGRTGLDADDARQDREGLRVAAPRLHRRRRGEGVGDRRARRRHQQPGSARQQAAVVQDRGRRRRGPSRSAKPSTSPPRQGRRHSEAAQIWRRGGRGATGAPGSAEPQRPRRTGRCTRRRAAPNACRRRRRSARRRRGGDAQRNRAMFPPTRITVGKNLGLHVSWFLYRGTAP